MSIITDALKLAATQEKLIAKQETEIAALKEKIGSLAFEAATSKEQTRLAKIALKDANLFAKVCLKSAKAEANAALAVVQAELKQVKAELKISLKTPKAVVAANDALGQVKRKPGRPKKIVVEAVVPEVDPRQIPLPDLDSPYILTVGAEPENVPQYHSLGLSAKGINYEFA